MEPSDINPILIRNHKSPANTSTFENQPKQRCRDPARFRVPGTEIKPDAISPLPTPPPHPPTPHPTPLRVLTGAHDRIDRIINEISKILEKAHGQIRACVELGLGVNLPLGRTLMHHRMPARLAGSSDPQGPGYPKCHVSRSVAVPL